MSTVTDWSHVPAHLAGQSEIVVTVPHPNGNRESEPQLIRQFNNAWTSVKRLLDRNGQYDGSWEFRCECGTNRKFHPQYFSDPYGAALHSRDKHRCA